MATSVAASWSIFTALVAEARKAGRARVTPTEDGTTLGPVRAASGVTAENGEGSATSLGG
ncbi:MAG: hypothetical protein M3272_07195 [Actinomycetota bacterium]|nr:hypothetical protein [Actinomycetota bacterium]